MPDEENKIYKTSPTTTGGKLIIELNTNNIKLFPLKLFITRYEDIRIDKIILSITAISDTYKDRETTLK
jgi:hypothetical protein